MLLVSCKNHLKHSPSFFIFFPCIFLSWLTYPELPVKWKKTPLDLDGFLPTEFNPEGCESFREGWVPWALSSPGSEQDTPSCNAPWAGALASTATRHQRPCSGSRIRLFMKKTLMKCRNYMHDSLGPWLSCAIMIHSTHQIQCFSVFHWSLDMPPKPTC